MADSLIAVRRDLERRERDVDRLTNTVNKQHEQILLLGNDLALVNAKTQRAGVTIGPLSIGSSDVTITWPKEWPDTVYYVGIELLTGTGALGNLHATLKAGSKTTVDCVVTVSASAAVASVGVDVVGVRT